MIFKVTVTGPESTGKTTLAQALAHHYQTQWVGEYARTYLDNLNRPYQEEDLLCMAKGQLASEEMSIASVKNLLICDTGLEVIKIWSEVKYQRCHPWIIEKYEQQKVDLYLLCAPDIPWEYDPQRENAENRDALFKIYQQELTGKACVEIWGNREKRFQTAVQAIDNLCK